MIYWDHNATSPLRPIVKAKMIEALDAFPANSSSGHSLGQASRQAIENARQSLARALGTDAGELIFTASATEANLMALWGLWWGACQGNSKAKKILVSPLEHSAIYENAKWLSDKCQTEVVYTPLDKKGLVDLQKLEELLAKKEWALCSVVAAHNETGVLQPWIEISKLCQKYGVPFHTDLVQYFGRYELALKSSGVTAATVAFHKCGGPKGIGVLYMRNGVPFEPLVRGGGQEKKRRAGTSNVSAIVGAGAIADEVPELIRLYSNEVKQIRDHFEKELLSRCSSSHLATVQIVGADVPRLPNTTYALFEGVKSDALMMGLDVLGICTSTGSACSSGLVLPSRALLQLGYSDQQALSGLRFSLGTQSTMAEAKTVLEALETALRRMAA